MTRTTLSQTEIAAKINTLRAAAGYAMAQYPQYQGHYDGAEWVLVQVKTNIKTKLGQAFAKGEYALAKLDTLEGKPCWTVYSRSNKCNTMIALNKATKVN